MSTADKPLTDKDQADRDALVPVESDFWRFYRLI